MCQERSQRVPGLFQRVSETPALQTSENHELCGLPGSNLDAEFILSNSRIGPKEDIVMRGIQIIVP